MIKTDSDLDLTHLKRFVRSKVIPLANTLREDSPFPIEIYEELHRMGWLTGYIPEELGGQGISTLDLMCMARELGYGSAGVFTSVAVNILAMTAVLLYAPEALRAELCRDFTSRFFLWSFCMTEPESGSNISDPHSTAKRTSGGYLLSGHKWLITNANQAEKYIVFAGVPSGDTPRKNLTGFYVPADSQGITKVGPLRKLGQHDSDTGEIFFDDVFIPESHRIGAEGDGIRVARHTLQRSKTLIAGASVGVCARAYDLVTTYLRDRMIYPKPLLSFPVIQNQLAQLETEARAAWLLSCDAAAAWERGKSIGQLAIKEASMAKMYASHTAVKYVSEALELMGGYGYAREAEISRLYRDCRLLEIYEGPTLVQQALISRELFRDPSAS